MLFWTILLQLLLSEPAFVSSSQYMSTDTRNIKCSTLADTCNTVHYSAPYNLIFTSIPFLLLRACLSILFDLPTNPCCLSLLCRMLLLCSMCCFSLALWRLWSKFPTTGGTHGRLCLSWCLSS